MSLLTSLLWTGVLLLGVLAMYAAVSSVLLLYLDLPDDWSFEPVEDLAFGLALPLLVVVVLVRDRIRRRRLQL